MIKKFENFNRPDFTRVSAPEMKEFEQSRTPMGISHLEGDKIGECISSKIRRKRITEDGEWWGEFENHSLSIQKYDDEWWTVYFIAINAEYEHGILYICDGFDSLLAAVKELMIFV